jgi:tripartite-type tricarboxylate transporter receptor subunit TctC
VIGAWRGVSGAHGLTEAQIDYWEGVLAAAVGTEAWTAELARLYWTPMYLDGARLREHLKRERGEMKVMLTDLGLLKRSTSHE